MIKLHSRHAFHASMLEISNTTHLLSFNICTTTGVRLGIGMNVIRIEYELTYIECSKLKRIGVNYDIESLFCG